MMGTLFTGKTDLTMQTVKRVNLRKDIHKIVYKALTQVTKLHLCYKICTKNNHLTLK